MRKGINTLCGIFHNVMGGDIRNGDVFVFVGGRNRIMKLIHAEDGGMVMYVKRLEEGCFAMPKHDDNVKSYTMELRDLVVMVEGIVEDSAHRLRRLRTQRKEYVI